jgi:hypothetical protein
MWAKSGRSPRPHSRLRHNSGVPARHDRPQLKLIAPGASPEEAAAIVAALERFLRETAPAPTPAAPAHNPWQRAALLEGVGREPEGLSPWGDGHPWG